jgi:transposase
MATLAVKRVGEKPRPQFQLQCSNREYKRYLVTFYILDGATEQEAARRAGVDQKTVRRVVLSMRRGAGWRATPMQAPARTWTTSVMEAAIAILRKETCLTVLKLFEIMVQEGILKATSNKAGLARALRQHVHSKGWTINMQSTKSLHYISDQDRVERLKYSKDMLERLECNPNMILIFCDETTYEQSPHPKGRPES